MWWFLLLAVPVLGCDLSPGSGSVAKSPGDNFYKIMINGEVERYAPGQRYVVTLVGSRTHDVVQQFTKFKLVVEPLDPAAVRSPGRQGQFQLFADTLSKFDELCINTIVEADDLPKTEVQVMWRAPPAGSGCVVLKALVQEDSGRWFAEDGQLSHRICEDVAVSDPGCCACSTASYSMVFEGLWSPQTHPKNFPTEAMWLTHFSDVIGATHPKNFSFWGEGQIATDGFRSLAEWGSPGLLERELRQQGKLLRSIVKAPGLWHPRVNSNTTATFNVDRKRHLLSFASMFGPSPDWVVGVNGLELCKQDCTWEESKVIDLEPYDAGTDSGISYMSPNQETVPRERMYRITTMYPEDPRAPFYNPQGGPVPPLGRVYLRRTSVTERSCDDTTLQNIVSLAATGEEDARAAEKPQCAVSEWGPFSPCSVSCGKGLRMRTRTYRMPDKAAMFNCDRQLVSKEMCAAAVPECPNSKDPEEGEELSPVEDNTGICATSEWGQWSECSVTCGVGLSVRRRHFDNHMGLKKCPLVQLEESRKCMQPACSESEAESLSESSDPTCPTTPWSAWSPCSASCGPGVRFVTRLLLVPASQQQECAGRVELLRQRPCHEHDDCTVDMLTAKRICMDVPDMGPCRGYFKRWAFSSLKGMCVPFTYGGCRGNRNNFDTQQQCMDTCSIVAGGAPAPPASAPASPAGVPTVSSNYPGLTFTSIVPVPADNLAASTGESADCVVSGWSAWSPCSVSCGLGYQERTRQVIKAAGPGGAACPSRMSRRRRCSRPCY